MLKNIKLFFLFLLVLLPSAAFSAMTVSVEPASMKNNRQADLNLSGLIVRKVLWEDGALLMPVTVSNDRSYSDVKLTSRDLYLKMEDCFINGCREAASTDKPDLPVVTVEAIKKLNSKFRVTNIEISFDSSIIVSVGIMAENYPNGTFWLSYPQSIDFSSSELKEKTDDVIFSAYAAENPHINVSRALQAGGAKEGGAAKTDLSSKNDTANASHVHEQKKTVKKQSKKTVKKSKKRHTKQYESAAGHISAPMYEQAE